MNIKVDIPDLDLTSIVDEVFNEIPPSIVYNSHQATKDVFAYMMGSRNSKKSPTSNPMPWGTTPTPATPRRSGISWGRMNVGDNR